MLEQNARPGPTDASGTGAASSLAEFQHLSHRHGSAGPTLTFHQLDGLAATLEALGLLGAAPAIAGHLARGGVVLRFGARTYTLRAGGEP
jgi:hypothetical protein